MFEGHLAAATSRTVITESNSLLISQLLYLDPPGPPRQPPKYIIERLKTLNETIKLGKLLCLSREPDFLLSIIQCQVTLCPTGNYMVKVNNRSTRTRCEICSKLTIKTPMASFWCLYC